ncbi:MAG: VWA domain-containing protein [Acidobacteriota bacterium]
MKRNLVTLLVALGLAAFPALQADELRLTSDRVMIEVLDGRGRAVEELSGDDLEILEAGEKRSALELLAPGATGREPWRITLLFDAVLTGDGSMARSARVLEEQAEALADLGWVEVVVADPEPRLVLPASRDAVALSNALGRVSLLEEASDALTRERRETLRLLAAIGDPEERQEALVEAVQREEALVLERHRVWLSWLAAAPPRGPQAVLLVNDGYDLDPAAGLGALAGLELAPERSLLEPSQDLARALAAYGWVALPVALRQARDSQGSRFGAVYRGDDPGGEDVPVLGTIRLPGRRSAEERAAEDEVDPFPAQPYDGLRALAQTTGGEVLAETAAVGDALARLATRWELRFSGARHPASEGSLLEVRPQTTRWQVRGPRWVGGATPSAVAALRADRLLAGDDLPSDLEVVAVVEKDPPQPRLEARVAVGPTSSPLPRVTLVAIDGEGKRQVIHQRVDGVRGEDAAQLRLSLPIDLAPGVDRVAVLVEDLASGRWGGTLAGLVVRGEESEAARDAFFDADLGLLPAPKAVNLLRPEGGVLRGEVTFETVVSDPAVRRVEFLLDGRTVGERSSAPYAVPIGLGRLPLRRVIEALAYEAAGQLVGRDELAVNEGGRELTVRITEPVDPTAIARSFDVAAEIDVPEGRRLERVELFWNDRLMATLFSPPFRHRMPAIEGDAGFVRVAARLDDGTIAEDSMVLGQGSSERVEVNLVELYVVVADRAGRPVKGLERDVFEVREGGQTMALAGFSDASDMPMTVGMAIDSSASMFAKLPAVQEAARAFLDGLEAGRDRAFLVEFDSRPSLASAPTDDLGRVAEAVSGLEAGGQTSLWESIVFSLVQLQGSRGRKALVVYSDGADQDKGFRYRTCLRFARKLGIPVYVIVSNNEAVRTEGLGLRTFGDRLERLTSAVGGKTYLVRSGQDLGDVYREIERELSSQYLLTYYSDTQGLRGWRGVEVDVQGRGLSARTVAGFDR